MNIRQAVRINKVWICECDMYFCPTYFCIYNIMLYTYINGTIRCQCYLNHVQNNVGNKLCVKKLFVIHNIKSNVVLVISFFCKKFCALWTTYDFIYSSLPFSNAFFYLKFSMNVQNNQLSCNIACSLIEVKCNADWFEMSTLLGRKFKIYTIKIF